MAPAKLIIAIITVGLVSSALISLSLSRLNMTIDPVVPPTGCYYQEVQCIKAPCDPVLVCPVTPTPQKTGCMVGGCSGQICGEEGEELFSTCEYRAEYACYKSAACERQPNGQCGWTPTAELLSCLKNPPPLE